MCMCALDFSGFRVISFLTCCLPVCILMGASLSGDAFALRRPVRKRCVRKVGEGSVGYVMYSRGGKWELVW